jgi:signal transduction histidine kinase
MKLKGLCYRYVAFRIEHDPGTGMDLPLCKKIVEYHGGRIWVQSELGKDTTFSCTIPGRGESA